MTSWVEQILTWVTENPDWIGGIVFLASMTESLVVVGLAVPGVAIMVASAGLIATGSAAFLPLYLYAVVGASLGDSISFWLGYYFADRLRQSALIKKRQAAFDKSEALFKRWGVLSVFIGRFFGPIRAIIPLIAGMMKMPTTLFMAANISSALLWAAVYFVPGWLIYHGWLSQ